MTDTFNAKIPAWFWAIGALAVLWNAMGVLAYLNQAFMSAESFAKLTEVEASVIESQPTWYVAAFATAVFAGFLGALLLLLRSRWATILLVISFLGVATQSYYLFAIAKVQSMMSGAELVMPLMIPAISLLLILFSLSSKKKGYLK